MFHGPSFAMFSSMTVTVPSAGKEEVWDTLGCFAQLFRALLPRATNVVVFNAAGQIRWSSDPTVGPDLSRHVAAVLPAAQDPTIGGDGALEMLGEQPTYLFWIRADDGALLAIVAVLTRPGSTEAEKPAFSFAQSLLRPALDCLRRELLAIRTVDELKSSMGELDEDLKLLLADAADANKAAEGYDELKSL